MSRLRIGDLRLKTDDQLADELLRLKREQFNLRFRKASGELAEMSGIRTARRNVARVRTVMAERSRGRPGDGRQGGG